MFTWEETSDCYETIREKARAAEGSVCRIDVDDCPGNSTCKSGAAKRTRMRAEARLVKAYPRFACFACRLKASGPERRICVSYSDLVSGDAKISGW